MAGSSGRLCRKCWSIKLVPVDESTLQRVNDSLGCTVLNTPLQRNQRVYIHYQKFVDVEKSANQDDCFFCFMIQHELRHSAYVFGGRDVAGSWRPKEEEKSAVIITSLPTSSQGVSTLMVHCGDRSFQLTAIHIPGR